MNRTLTKFLAGAAIVASSITGAAAIGAATDTATPTKTNIDNPVNREVDTVTFGGCIRIYPDSSRANGVRLKWHVDEGHHTVGINPRKDPVIDAAGFITFRFSSNTDPVPVIATSATPDETLVSRGISAGVSNGTHLIRIRLYDSKLDRPLNMNNRADARRVASPVSNLWFLGTNNVGAIPRQQIGMDQ